jgi:hypothetical protein
LIASTGRKRTILRVKTGSEEFEWLMKNVAVFEIETDDEVSNLIKLDFFVTDGGTYKQMFIYERGQSKLLHSDRLRSCLLYCMKYCN